MNLISMSIVSLFDEVKVVCLLSYLHMDAGKRIWCRKCQFNSWNWNFTKCGDITFIGDERSEWIYRLSIFFLIHVPYVSRTGWILAFHSFLFLVARKNVYPVIIPPGSYCAIHLHNDFQ